MEFSFAKSIGTLPTLKFHATGNTGIILVGLSMTLLCLISSMCDYISVIQSQLPAAVLNTQVSGGAGDVSTLCMYKYTG